MISLRLTATIPTSYGAWSKSGWRPANRHGDAKGVRRSTTIHGVRALARILVAGALTLAGPPALAQDVGSSLLLLIDASRSMGDPVGGASSQAKIDAAKDAAAAALGRAAKTGAVEVAVLAFSGDCANPVPRYQDFTRDVARLTAFIAGLQPGGGTPMADALLFANRFMERNGQAGAADRMIMLLADGQNDCGDVGQAMATLQGSGIIFRHETVGFGITPNSPAAADLREIATQTGGTYHHAADATQLADVFMEFVNTFSVIDLLGQFGNANPPPPSPSPSAGAKAQADDDGLTGLLGGFEAPADDSSSLSPPLHGALAIDSGQGRQWGWAIDYPSPSEAARRALAECGRNCSIAMRFGKGCAAFAADQGRGSTAHGWSNGYDTGADARTRALAECRGKGGESCIVPVWGCTRR